MAVALNLTTRNMIKPFWTGFRALGSVGRTVGLDIGGIGLNVGWLVIPMKHDSTGENFSISGYGAGGSIGVSPFPVTLEIAPEHLPSWGIGTVFAMPGTKRPFTSAMLDGYVLFGSAAYTRGTGASVTVVAWMQGTGVLIDPNPSEGKYSNVIAFCLLKGAQYGTPSTGATGMIMRAKRVPAAR
ncbi:hypothetical protein R3X27_19910 [Tropicimonas sp. TH_r6]|uniref:hypothetical protein n=1 Tax=Tropicimonas sp. TH_r6 TaxID=3082085 RepID=UPI0029537960|nr:hypothetical protein [Tropicimonas sp. TH_r6]MDV7144953.1 hypothetical protein [Tropicimonas sp. TH_r6]